MELDAENYAENVENVRTIRLKLWTIDSIKQQKTLIFQYIIKIFVCGKQKQAELMHQEEPKLKQSK